MSKLSVLQSQLPTLPRCIYTGGNQRSEKSAWSPLWLCTLMTCQFSFLLLFFHRFFFRFPCPSGVQTARAASHRLPCSVCTCCLINLHEIQLSSYRSSVLKVLVIVPNVHWELMEARGGAKHWTCILKSSLPAIVGTILSPFCKVENWGIKRKT